jgi:hypothetical protein
MDDVGALGRERLGESTGEAWIRPARALQNLGSGAVWQLNESLLIVVPVYRDPPSEGRHYRRDLSDLTLRTTRAK